MSTKPKPLTAAGAAAVSGAVQLGNLWRGMTDRRVHLLADLSAVSGMLHEAWINEVVPLRVSMALFRALSPHLANYDSADWIFYWYQAYLVMGCRRLVGHGHDEVSMRKALHTLREIADDVTAEILSHHRSRGSTPSDERESAHLIVQYRGETQHSKDLPLGRRTVQLDLDRIADVADRVHHVATHRFAHRLNRPPQESVTFGEIRELLEQLAAIHRRWSIILRAADVDMSIDHLVHPDPIGRALQLFNYDEFVDAASREVMRNPEAWANGGIGAAIESARIEYRFGDQG